MGRSMKTTGIYYPSYFWLHSGGVSSCMFEVYLLLIGISFFPSDSTIPPKKQINSLLKKFSSEYSQCLRFRYFCGLKHSYRHNLLDTALRTMLESQLILLTQENFGGAVWLIISRQSRGSSRVQRKPHVIVMYHRR